MKQEPGAGGNKKGGKGKGGQKKWGPLDALFKGIRKQNVPLRGAEGVAQTSQLDETRRQWRGRVR